jgi:hypothetical protein
VTNGQGKNNGALTERPVQIESGLVAVANARPMLPAAMKAGILAMLKAAEPEEWRTRLMEEVCKMQNIRQGWITETHRSLARVQFELFRRLTKLRRRPTNLGFCD